MITKTVFYFLTFLKMVKITIVEEYQELVDKLTRENEEQKEQIRSLVNEIKSLSDKPKFEGKLTEDELLFADNPKTIQFKGPLVENSIGHNEYSCCFRKSVDYGIYNHLVKVRDERLYNDGEITIKCITHLVKALDEDFAIRDYIIVPGYYKHHIGNDDSSIITSVNEFCRDFPQLQFLERQCKVKYDSSKISYIHIFEEDDFIDNIKTVRRLMDYVLREKLLK